MKMTIPVLMLTVLLVGSALSLVAPVIAPPGGNGPKYTKWVATLEDGSDNRVGQVILNTNDEDDTEAESYELEVEVEESGLADGTYDVNIDGSKIGEVTIVDGDGKVTIYVDSLPDLGTDVISVDGLATDPTTERLWAKAKGPK